MQVFSAIADIRSESIAAEVTPCQCHFMSHSFSQAPPDRVSVVAELASRKRPLVCRFRFACCRPSSSLSVVLRAPWLQVTQKLRPLLFKGSGKVRPSAINVVAAILTVHS